MQDLSISDDLIVLKFDTVKKLDRNINYLINTNVHMQKKGAIINEIQNLHPSTIVGDEAPINIKIKSILIKEILNDEKLPTDIEDDDDDNDPSDIPIATVAEEIEPEIDHFGGDLQQLL